MSDRSEERLDRRAHWAQAIIGLVILVTGWCVRLEFTVIQLKQEADRRQASVDLNRENRNADMLKIEQRVRTNEVDIEWLKRLVRD